MNQYTPLIFLLTIGFSTLFWGEVVCFALEKIKAYQPQLKGFKLSSLHKSKEYTPSIGGIIFIVPLTLLSCVFLNSIDCFCIIAATLLFGGIGLLDDVTKIKSKNNKGLSKRVRVVMALIASFVSLYFARDEIAMSLHVPLYGELDVSMINSLLLYIFNVFVLIGAGNSVNLTDGLDGLAASTTSIVAFGMAYLCYMLGFIDISLLNLAAGVACVVFLRFNAFKARIFMGDTGSLALGALLGMTSIISGLQLFLAISGFVFVAETLSVVFQVAYFKWTRKRLLLCAPLHHHFEYKGWHEVKITRLFCFFAIVCSLLSVGVMKI